MHNRPLPPAPPRAETEAALGCPRSALVTPIAHVSPEQGEWWARHVGWHDRETYNRCFAQMVACAWRVIVQRAQVNDPCMAAVDVEDGIVDRVGVGVLVLDTPHTITRAAVKHLAMEASRLVWPAHLRRRALASRIIRERYRTEADELAESREAEQAHAYAKVLGAA